MGTGVTARRYRLQGSCAGYAVVIEPGFYVFGGNSITTAKAQGFKLAGRDCVTDGFGAQLHLRGYFLHGEVCGNLIHD